MKNNKMKKRRIIISGTGAGIKKYGELLNTAVISLFLIITYVLGVGISSLIAKLFRKHFLEMNMKKETYWSDLNITKKTKEHYYKQF